MRCLIFSYLVVVLSITGFLFSPVYGQEAPTYDDPFYKLKGAGGILGEGTNSPFQRVEESVDPFTGNLNLLHTDIDLPGNGGLDLLIQRTYNSRIWGRKDTSFPGLVAKNEKSVLGIGWSFHFGRVLNPWGTGSANRFLPDNPVIEMPDGSTHPLYRDKNNSGQKISREYWLYESFSTSGPARFELTLTDGTLYTFVDDKFYVTGDGIQVLPVESIETTDGNTINFTYDSSDGRLITRIDDSTGRAITFTYQTISGSGYSHKALKSISVNGKLYRYYYTVIDAMIFLDEVDPPIGPSWEYTYYTSGDQKYELKTVEYPSGAVLTYDYDDRVKPFFS